MEKTIAAISTAYGESGIGIVRMSGPDSLNVLKRIFVPAGGEFSTLFAQPRTMHYGKVISGEDTVDEALAVYFKAPHSYTGEDMAEIQCHGSLVSIKNILALCLANGAVPAEKGEFTKLAFLNGKLDLSQAEAVIDLIKAKTDRSFNAAMDQKEGKLSEKVKAIRNELMEQLIQISVNMDYPDEDIEEVQYKSLLDSLSQINDEISVLLNSASEGKVLRDGLALTIVGKPNVGKSSLMNLLLSEDRSIVTEIPGTTRDTIEETASIRGIPVRITDTAGIRESSDKVEALGIERSKAALDRADLLLLVLDGSRELDTEDEMLLDLARDRSCVIALNKQDLPQVLNMDAVIEKLPDAQVIRTEFASGKGLEELKDIIESRISSGKVTRENAVLITNARHERLLAEAREELIQAEELINAGEALDFIEINVKSAFDDLGEITGDTASDEIINEIFSRFCLGK